MIGNQTKDVLLAEYGELRDAGAHAIHQGRFGDAKPLYEEALAIARRIGEQRLIDLAFCNLAGARIELWEMSEVLASLREILVRSDDGATCRLSAYHISRIYELRGEARKGLFYARIARDRTAQLDSPDPAWIASGHNSIANFLVADSRFDEALKEYVKALEAHPDAPGYRVPAIRQNIGYCHLMLGRPKMAFDFLYSAMRTYRRLGSAPVLALNHLDLAYAYLEIGRPRPAIRNAQKALALAQRHNDEANVKNALYLLGEAWHLSGDDDRARNEFERLADCYDLPFIADFLLTVDVRQMINLRA